VKDIKLMPFAIVKPNGDAWVRARQGLPQQVSRKAAQDEEDGRGLSRHEVTEAVITVPAYFNDPSARPLGCRPHRRSRGQAHHQRADRGCARVRHRQDRQGRPQDRIMTLATAARHRSSGADVEGEAVEVLSTNSDTFLGGETTSASSTSHEPKGAGADLSKDVLRCSA
jgi:hypothetical protein